MTEHTVGIVGAGPAGMMLAAELALADVDVAIIERRRRSDTLGTRGLGLQALTLDLFDQRGVVERFLEAGQVAQVNAYAGVRLDIADFPTRHPHGLALPQDRVEAIMADWIDELPVTLYREREVTGFTQDEDAVTVALTGGAAMRAKYLVGCDGGGSSVRRTAGIGFPGAEATTTSIVAEVSMTEAPVLGFTRDVLGQHAIGPMAREGAFRLVVVEAEVHRAASPTLDELRAALTAVYGTDFGAHAPTWIGRFSNGIRQAETYRRGRVLLAGDAAHVHSPVGGQGLHLGVQDAVNLGWKLAQVVRETSSATLLDTYERERRPATARILRSILAQTALMQGDDRTDALRESLAELAAMDEPRKHLGAMLSGLDVQYDLGGGHALIGRRVPDLDLVTADGPRRIFELLRAGRPFLITLGAADEFVLGQHASRVEHVEATFDGPWELPVIGAVDPPAALLVRPDGVVVWAGGLDDPALPSALRTWFG